MQGSQELPVCSADNALVRNQLTPVQGIECLDVLIWNSTVEMESRWIWHSRQVKYWIWMQTLPGHVTKIIILQTSRNSTDVCQECHIMIVLKIVLLILSIMIAGQEQALQTFKHQPWRQLPQSSPIALSKILRYSTKWNLRFPWGVHVWITMQTPRRLVHFIRPTVNGRNSNLFHRVQLPHPQSLMLIGPEVL